MDVTRAGDPLTVATWNLHEGLPAAGGSQAGPEPATDEVVRLLTDRRVDIAAFQEVGFDAGGGSELLEEVRRRTELRHVTARPLHASSFFPERLSGVAVASRYPLRDPEAAMLPNPRLRTEIDGEEIHSHDKGLVGTTVSLWGLDLRVVSLHAFPFHLFRRAPDETEFKEVWDALADELRRRGEHDRLLVCGDFNTDDRSLMLRADSLPLSSSLEGRPTYRDRSYDDILHGAAVTLTGVDVVENFSDHRVCIASFRPAAGVGHRPSA
ncbi:endonuclease/exonuclease/phosphatase family protein [Streptomyces sp. NPDC005529]|uniref:endonuclease/exonuclease/phosphatase family protein n=1 Tax=unclassified Streptomyces TaxID=2593676 RepID=UPI0033B2B243